MNNKLVELKSNLQWLQAEEDTPSYREEWGLGDEVWEFDQNTEERAYSMVAEFAKANNLSVYAVDLALNKV